MPANRPALRRPAFTLVEILIVVVILGVLAAIVVPQFANATTESSQTTTRHELEKLRRAVGVYQVRNSNALPPVQEGHGTWGDLVARGEYLGEAPANPWVGGDNRLYVIISDTPDAAYQTDHAWIFDDQSGDVWAGGFDADDEPLPKP